MTSRQWMFGLLALCDQSEDVVLSKEECRSCLGVGLPDGEISGEPEDRVSKSADAGLSFSLQSSSRRRYIRPKLPRSAWSPSEAARSARTVRKWQQGVEKTPVMNNGQTRERSNPLGPDGMHWRVSAIAEMRLRLLNWYRSNPGTRLQR